MTPVFAAASVSPAVETAFGAAWAAQAAKEPGGKRRPKIPKKPKRLDPYQKAKADERARNVRKTRKAVDRATAKGKGITSQEIAEQLGLSPHTINNYLKAFVQAGKMQYVIASDKGQRRYRMKS